jgi:hypothetical protein
VPNTALYTEFGFIQPVHTSTQTRENLLYLDNIGCWYLPCKALLDEFVHEYFRYVHSLLPIVNDKHFWDCYSPDTSAECSPQRMSLLLLYCVLCEAAQVG